LDTFVTLGLMGHMPLTVSCPSNWSCVESRLLTYGLGLTLALVLSCEAPSKSDLSHHWPPLDFNFDTSVLILLPIFNFSFFRLLGEMPRFFSTPSFTFLTLAGVHAAAELYSTAIRFLPSRTSFMCSHLSSHILNLLSHAMLYK
jgi:hypothetical protein